MDSKTVLAVLIAFGAVAYLDDCNPNHTVHFDLNGESGVVDLAADDASWEVRNFGIKRYGYASTEVELREILAGVGA